jgi:hypothetical protein
MINVEIVDHATTNTEEERGQLVSEKHRAWLY